MSGKALTHICVGVEACALRALAIDRDALASTPRPDTEVDT
ncbi:MAG: hypothetical protein QM820_51865 [Minicystis sp.]